MLSSISSYKRDIKVTMTMSGNTRKNLEALAKRYNMSYSGVVEALINESFNQHKEFNDEPEITADGK